MKSKLLLIALLFALNIKAQIPEISSQHCYNLDIREKTHSICETENGYLLALEVYGDTWLPDIHGNYDILIYNIDTSGNIIWEKFFGGSNIDKPKKIIKAGNNDYYILGETNSIDGDVQSGNQGIIDLWVLKINSQGEILWEKTYGGPGMDYAKDIILMPEGGFMITGSIKQAGGDIGNHIGEDDAWHCRCDNQGDIIWEKTLGGEGWDYCNSLTINNNGNIMMIGSTGSHNNSSNSSRWNWDDVWVAELDLQGNILWDHLYGGSKEDIGYKIEDIYNGYIILAKTQSDNGDVTGHHHWGDDIWVVRTDYQGNIIWQKCLGGYDAYSTPVFITQTESEDFIIIGNTSAYNGDVTNNHTVPNGSANDIWIVKLSSTGQIIWQQCYGGVNDESLNDLFTVIKKSDHHYVLATQSNSNNSFDVNCNLVNLSSWLIEIETCPNYFPATPDEPEGVDTICSANYLESNFSIPPPANAWTFEWKITPDSAGIITGNGLQAIVSWQADFEGTAEISVRSANDCGESQWSQPHYTQVYTCLGTEELLMPKIKVYPNPATKHVIFELPVIARSIATKQSPQIIITNTYGQQITQLEVKDNKTVWDTRAIPTGIYFYTFMVDGFSKSGKVIIQH